MPHLIALTSFLPLERVRPIVWARRRFSADEPPADPEPANAAPTEAAAAPGSA
jgi:hypothetical protein